MADGAAKIPLYGNFLSNHTYKVALMLSLCGLPYAYRHIDLSTGAHKKPDFLAISRYGQVPALTHGARALVQSNVIIDYLGGLAGRFHGSDEAELIQAREWLAWEADRLSPYCNRVRLFVRFMKPDPAVADYFRRGADAGLKVLDDLLAGRDFLVGAGPTIADIGGFAAVAHAAEAKLDLAVYPNITAWRARIAALPGFKLPYDLLPQSDVA